MTRAKTAKTARVKADILIQSRRWDRLARAKSIVRRALEAAAEGSKTKSAEVTVVLTHDKAIRELNHQFRGFDKATNVLSFPSSSPDGHIGDIVIAYETMAREAKDDAKTLGHHLSHMAVHGFLHLVGHDHENIRDANKMEALETRVLATLGIADPYADTEVVKAKKSPRKSR